MLRAGRFDRWVRIEGLTETQDATGQPVESWDTFVQVWMGKRSITAREQLAAGIQDLASEVTIWAGHWVDGIEPEMRLVDGEKTYNIESVVEIGRFEEIELRATAVRV